MLLLFRCSTCWRTLSARSLEAERRVQSAIPQRMRPMQVFQCCKDTWNPFWPTMIDASSVTCAKRAGRRLAIAETSASSYPQSAATPPATCWTAPSQPTSRASLMPAPVVACRRRTAPSSTPIAPSEAQIALWKSCDRAMTNKQTNTHTHTISILVDGYLLFIITGLKLIKTLLRMFASKTAALLYNVSKQTRAHSLVAYNNNNSYTVWTIKGAKEMLVLPLTLLPAE